MVWSVRSRKERAMDLGTGDRLAMPTAGADDGGQARPLPPLAVSGLVPTKAALVRALRVSFGASVGIGTTIPASALNAGGRYYANWTQERNHHADHFLDGRSSN
jgi:hypothetical protein